jgi:choline dehydrogenase-like flavoprotein
MWGGRCVPFEPIDFEIRPYAPNIDWPVAYEDVAAYFADACEWCVCGRSVWNAEQMPELAGRPIVPGFRDGRVTATNLERWSLPTRFGHHYRERLRSAETLDLVTGATCTQVICANTGDRVSGLTAASLSGTEFTVRAKHYVLAAGGLETTRLLLASADRSHPDGLGNASGHLGRWYTAHTEARVAQVRFRTDPQETQHSYELDRDGVYVRRRLAVHPDAQRQGQLLNGVVWLVNPDLADPTNGSAILSGVYLTLRSPIGKYMLADAIREAYVGRTSDARVAEHLRNVVHDAGAGARFAADFLYRRYLKPGRKVPGFFVQSAENVYPLDYYGEHLPHYESRVRLGTSRDALGVPRLITDMRFSDADVANAAQTFESIDAYLRELGIGNVELTAPDINNAVRQGLFRRSGTHQSGTTRMSARPEDGVVNADLAVHGIPNLHVASTSVLPSSSHANPTFTAIALALRLAAHLAGTRP